MECNKDEGLRAKEIAEKKFQAKDMAGARKFALKAQNLFPGLDGISQMITTLDVYLASERTISGEKDWYAILSVHPTADDETLRKQYRKMALMLHPDKNNSIGAEGAFQLISEAWSVLSDKSKRSLFDMKRPAKNMQQSTFPVNKDRSAPMPSNGFETFAKNTVIRPRATKRKAPAAPPSSAPPPKAAATPPKSAAAPKSAAPPPAAATPPSNVPLAPTAPPPRSAPSQPASKPSSFWTLCDRCKMQYEYSRIYLNCNLICPKCRDPFIAKEYPLPASRTNSSVPSPAAQQYPVTTQNSAAKNAFDPEIFPSGVPFMGSLGSQQVPNSGAYSSPKFQWGPFSRATGSASAAASTTAAVQAASMVQTYEKVRKEREEAQAAARFARREEVLQKKVNALKRKPDISENANVGLAGSVPYNDPPPFQKVQRPTKKRRSIGDDVGTASEATQTFTSTGNSGMASGMERTTGLSGDFFQPSPISRQVKFRWQLSQLDTRKMLMEKTQVTVCKTLTEWKSAKESNTADKENAKKKQKQKEIVKEDVKVAVPQNDTDQDLVSSRSSGATVPVKKDSSNNHSAELDSEVTEPVSIDVPDPDFHDFDKDRSEGAFEAGQIWATYDNEDGMPRYYALVQKVISLEPFKVRLAFLTSKSNSEFGPVNWVASGFSKTSGEFRSGRYEVQKTINIFSHKIRWEKGSRGLIKIVPQKGEIWALYRNWSVDWNVHTSDDVIYKYDMVEILENYNEEQGVPVAPLVKVAGFKTVFCRHQDIKKVKKIPREEMFRLSHQVPSILLTGEEGHNAPKGCYELDPAATPLELLQVITEAKDGEVVKIAEQQPVS